MNSGTLLLRQIHPAWLRDNRVTSQAFLPTPKDLGFLSVYDGDNITPEDAWIHYTEVERLTSAGVIAVTIEECEQSGLRVSHDPTPDNPEHITIDFNGLSRGQARRMARKLATLANERGWLFRPPPS